MATTSLGRLTLDLAVRLSEFSEGMSRAERETAERARNMSESIRTFRDQLMDDLGGTQLGSVIDGLSSRLGAISGGGMMAGAAIAGMAVGGVAVAIGSLARLAIETAHADAELQVLANRAKTNVETFQILSSASKNLGVEQDALAGILADVQEKLGEFSATGGGGAADFFEALQNNTRMTDEEIRNLGKTLQGKDGVEALQLIKDKMDELGATSQEQRFVFESLAGDLGNLLPLFAEGGTELGKYGDALREAGVIKTQAAIDQSRLLAAQTQAVQTRFEGFKSQLAGQMMPVLNSLMSHFVGGSKSGQQFGGVIKSVGFIARSVASSIVVLASGVQAFIQLIQGMYKYAYYVGGTIGSVLDADGLAAKAQALRQGATNLANISGQTTLDIVGTAKAALASLNSINTTTTGELDTLADFYYKVGDAADYSAQGLRINTKEAEANAQASEKAAKAAAAQTKATGAQTKAISNQMMVYKAFRHAGLSDNQARIITAEVGREGDYQSKYLFGGHSDPKNGKYNLGMISWQKERGKELYDYLKQLGLIQHGQIVKSQEALNAQAMFAIKEMTTKGRFAKTKNEFLANPDVSYQKGTEVLGKNYIAWRYTDPAYKHHHGRRDRYYNKLNAELGNSNVAGEIAQDNKAAEEALRAQEQLLKQQQSIVAKYATAREKIELEHNQRVSEIEKSFAKGSAEYTEYMAREDQRYLEEKNAAAFSVMSKYQDEREKLEEDHRKNIASIEDTFAEGSLERELYLAAEQERYLEQKNAKAQSIMLKYMSEEEKLKYDHEQKLKEIAEAGIEDDEVRQRYIDAQNEAYQKDLANFKFVQEQKAREADKLYQSIAQKMRDGISQAASNVLDRTAQLTMKPKDYAKWKMGEEHDQAFNSVNDQYANRQSEINATDDQGKYLLDEQQRNDLLEQARQEHLNAMWAMEQEHALKEKSLSEQIRDQRVAIYTSMFTSMTGAAATFFGENSRMHRAAFAMEQAYAAYKATMNAEETYSNVYTAISAIPVIGPYIAGPAAFAASALQIASAARIKGMTAPTVAGIAHGGLDNVPEEATYLLQKNERVLSPKQNKDLTKYLEQAPKAPSQGNIIINNNSSAKVEAYRAPDGTVTVDMVDRMIDRKFSSLANKNSHAAKQIQKHTTARPRR
ncbi:MAG: hypothetical protein Q4P13_11135 [Psychrobacter sp.]|nr:hypothetical protein [Psychrobacter sp.]